MMDRVTSNWFEEMTMDVPKLAWRDYLIQHYSLYGEKAHCIWYCVQLMIQTIFFNLEKRKKAELTY